MLILPQLTALILSKLHLRVEFKEKITVVILVFVFIATDPTVIGYFHTLLTEFMAAIIGAISIYIAIIFYKSTPFTKEFYFALAYFFLGVPLAWHIKQPYFGITFFPFFISLIFFLIRNKIKYKLILFTITLLIPVIFTFISTNLWNSFLISKGNPMKQERQLSYYVDMSLNENFVDLEFSPRKIIVNVVKRYAALSNYLQYDHMNFVFIDERPSFFQAKENTAISHRMFQNQSLSNSIIFPQERYFEYYSNLLDNYEPPVWLNKIFEKRIILSNFLFTTTYLFLPFLIIPFIYLVFKNMETFPLLLLCGTSLMNAVAHIFVLPIDRYLFWGYPLNLVMVMLLTIKIVKRIIRC